MAAYLKPRGWKVVKATGGITFVECKQTRFAFANNDDGAKAVASLLTRKDRQIARLQHQIRELLERS
jgi:hypothetical protein